MLSFTFAESKNRSDRSAAPRADATYLITGGHGGLGLEVARWLVEKGARHLVLLSRSGASSPGKAVAADLAAKGATITTIQADVSNESDLARALSEIRNTMPPLRGVIHAAGVLDDHLLLNLDAEKFRRVLAPKVLGAWNLHYAHRGFAARFLRGLFFGGFGPGFARPGELRGRQRVPGRSGARSPLSWLAVPVHQLGPVGRSRHGRPRLERPRDRRLA